MTILPDKVLQRMSPADRKRLGRAGVTSDEAQSKIEIKSERELQRQIANSLRLNDIPFNQDSMHKKRTGTLGWPDFTIVHKGETMFIEAKFGDGELSPEQVELHRRFALRGVKVHVVTSFTQYLGLLKGGGK